MSQPKEVIKKQIGDYCFNMDDVIGEGYSSKVYKGYHTATNSPVAVKVISLQSYTSPIQQSLLQNEIKILLQIDHPNLLKVHEISQSVNNTYIVSEYCEGGNLENIMEQEPLKIDKIINILTQVSRGLMGLHQKSKKINYIDIIHRDIKPANILIKDDTYKVADFGFALIENQYDSIIKKFNVGTPMYMAPEIKLFNQYSEKTDVWAIGIMLYEMLFLRIPDFKQSYKSLIDDTKKKCKTLEKQYQNQITEIFEGVLQLEPEDRLSIDQVMKILQPEQLQNKNSPLVKLSQKSISTQLNSPLQPKFKVPKTPNEIRKQYLEQLKSNRKPSSFDTVQFATMLRVKTCIKDEVSQFTMTTDDAKSSENQQTPKSHREVKTHKRQDSDVKIEFLGQVSTDCSYQEIQLPAILKPTYNFCQFLEQVIQTSKHDDELNLKYYFLLRKLLAIKAKVFYTFAPISIKDQLNSWINQLQEYYNTIKHLINLNMDKTFQLFFNPNLDDQGKLLMMYIVSLANQIKQQNIHIQTIVSILSDNLQHQNDPFLFARKWAQSQ